MAIREILYPTDFSDCAHHAGRYAALLARKLGAALHVLHVPFVPSPLHQGAWAAVSAEHLVHIAQHDADHYFERLRSEAEFQGLTVRTTVERGLVEEVIRNVAERSDLLVMGSHGRTGLARVMLGSVAEKVAGTARCPVLVVKHPDVTVALPWGDQVSVLPKAGQKSPRVLNILVPLDGSLRSEMVLDGAKEIACVCEAVLILFMAVSAPLQVPGVTPGGITPEEHTEIGGYLRNREEVLRREGFMAEAVQRTGDDAALAILEYAERRDVDVTAMTTHGRSGLRRWLLGSVAEKVLRASSVPVLLYRAWGEPR